ncbi:MAG TPA: DUF4167 domain-containing protein [Paracoccaceae bacterium]|nr:DUF4167 domain-containing protein [Paracoccaceae bacterium]
MNNQRNNNNNSNRRRGRGSNRGGNSGGAGNQGNRIDSRARGNAPQMLEKYRKLAQEAQLNDDRVQTEYFLQFADHYFRVIADGRAAKDDGRPQQAREQSGFDDGYDDEERDEQRDEPRRDEPRRDEGRPRQQQQPRRNDAGDADGEGETRSEARPEPRSEPRAERRPERRPRSEQRNEPRKEQRSDNPTEAVFEVRPGAEGDQDQGDNPFSGKPRRKPRARKPDDDDAGELGLNPAMLPPAIGRTMAAPVDDDRDDQRAEAPLPTPREEAAANDSAEKPRRRLKMPRARSGDEEELAAVE